MTTTDTTISKTEMLRRAEGNANYNIEQYSKDLDSEDYKGWSSYDQEVFAREALEHLPQEERTQAYQYVMASDLCKSWDEDDLEYFIAVALEYLPQGEHIQAYQYALASDAYKSLKDSSQLRCAKSLVKHLPREERIQAYKCVLASDAYKSWHEDDQKDFAIEALKHLPREERTQAYKCVLASDAYKNWDEENQEDFAIEVLENLPRNLTSVFVTVTKNRVITANPEGTTNPDYDIILAFDNENGIGMLGGCQDTLTDGPEELLERYKGRQSSGGTRPSQCLRIAFVAQAVLDTTRDQLPEGVAKKMEEDIKILAPKGWSETTAKRFEREMPVEVLGLDEVA